MWETLRSAGARAIGLRALSINISLRWSASYRVESVIYKHLAPLERNQLYCGQAKLNAETVVNSERFQRKTLFPRIECCLTTTQHERKSWSSQPISFVDEKES